MEAITAEFQEETEPQKKSWWSELVDAFKEEWGNLQDQQLFFSTGLDAISCN